MRYMHVSSFSTAAYLRASWMVLVGVVPILN
jgi:hypothetical protein